MNNWYEWVFSGIGVFIIGLLFRYSKNIVNYFTGIKFLDRSEIDKYLGTVHQRLDRTQSYIYISGNDGKFVVESMSAQLEMLLRQGKRLKLLLSDPNSNVPEMLSMIDPRFPTPSDFRSSMHTVLEILRKWKYSYPNNFEYRLLPFLPALGFFITDAESKKGIVKIEIYTAEPWQPINSRPHIVINNRAKKWRSYFINQWENYWNRGRTP
ncbi:MAG: hypothetical protein KF721_15665 [Ignavibacteriaceae bacterium]|nr:hypothetical protein [Ignavibacteriaceae bacterium]